MARGTPPRVMFLGSTYAGHETRFLNLEAHSRGDARIRPTYRRVSGWKDGGFIERTAFLPQGARGRARALLTAAPLARLPRPDVIWTSAREALTPYLWAQAGPLRRPMVLDLDWTLDLQEQSAGEYFRRPPKHGLWRVLAERAERALWRATTVFTPWSHWAADSLRASGISDDRIRVIPPGVDLDVWRPMRDPGRQPNDPLRLLFVGGDFSRKGGPELLDVFRSRFSDSCELDIVTRQLVQPSRGVRIHKASANSAELRDLYRRADLFVLPTKADCFGIATIEAMASGLPVIVGDVGGARDIVVDGETGWLIPPTAEALATAIELAIDRAASLPAMGRFARRRAEVHFDGRRNDSAIVDLLLELADIAASRVRAAASVAKW